MRGRRVVTMLVVALAATGCSGDDDGGGAEGGDDATTTTATAPLEGSLDVGDVEAPDRCDPLDARHCLLPFPSDTFTVADPAAPTGRRIALARESMPVNKDGVRVDPVAWNANDGFSPGQPISLFVPGLDVVASGIATLDDIEASLADDAPVVLLDATTGERHPYWAELDASVESDEARVLYIRPAVNFPEEHRIVVALRDLTDTTGAVIEPSSKVFVAYRDRLDTGVPEIEERRARYEQVFADLRAAGVARDELYLAWDFTVASAESIAGPMLQIRDDAFATLGDAAPVFRVEQVEESPEPELARRVTGTVDVPLYLTGTGEPGSRLQTGADGPVRNGDAVFAAHFICNVPTTATAEPARISLYGHGLLGSNGEVNAGNVRRFAQEHNIVFCATPWIGMSGEDVPNAISILNDLSNFPTLADRGLQGFLNALFLGRAMKHPDGFAAHEAFRTADGATMLDASELYYDGNSQGAIMGGALTAVSTEFERAVLGVPGMNYSTLLQRSVDWDTYRAVYDPAYPDEIERGIGLSLIQMLWDRAEANGYAQHMTDDPLPGTPAHQVLLHVAFADHQVSQYAAEVEARTIGARLRCPATADGRMPEANPHWGLECVEGDGYDGSVIVYWDSGTPPPPLDNRAPREGDDPHEDPRAQPAAREQKSAFLAPDGAFVDVCGADPCRSTPAG